MPDDDGVGLVAQGNQLSNDQLATPEREHAKSERGRSLKHD